MFGKIMIVAGVICTIFNYGLASEPEKIIFKVKTEKAEDRIEVNVEKDIATMDIISPSGIGGATVILEKGNWPATIILHLHLKGLESFNISNGKTKLVVSLISHTEKPKRFYLVENDEEKQIEKGDSYWMDLKVVDVSEKTAKGLQKKDYIEMRLPKAFLKENPKSLELGWIDFYRR